MAAVGWSSTLLAEADEAPQFRFGAMINGVADYSATKMADFDRSEVLYR